MSWLRNSPEEALNVPILHSTWPSTCACELSVNGSRLATATTHRISFSRIAIEVRLSSGSYVGLDGRTLLPFRPTMRPDRVATNSRRNNKRLGKVHDEGRKRSVGTFDDRLFPFAQVQHVHSAVRAVQHCSRKPVSPGFNELALVQTGAFFLPSVSRADRRHRIYKLFLYPVSCAIPLVIQDAVFQ